MRPKRSDTTPFPRYAQPMAVVDKLLEQALQLLEKERGELAGRLLRSGANVGAASTKNGGE